jgi:hypothetical protein
MAGLGRVAAGIDGDNAGASLAPQEVQKFEPGTLSCWQAVQVITCGEPQWLQNRLSIDKLAPQLRQAMAKGCSDCMVLERSAELRRCFRVLR